MPRQEPPTISLGRLHIQIEPVGWVVGLFLSCLCMGAFFLSWHALRDTSPTWPLLKLAAGGGLGLWASLITHELSHGIAGHLRSLPGASITLSWWGSGYDPWEDPSTPEDNFWIHLPGPLTHFLWALLCFQIGALTTGGWQELALGTAWFQTLLGIGNLLPLLPLDGAYLLNSLAWKISGSRSWGLKYGSRLGTGLTLMVGLLALATLNITLPLKGGILVALLMGSGWSIMVSRDYRRFYEGLQNMNQHPLKTTLHFQPPHVRADRLVEDLPVYQLPNLVVDEQGEVIGVVGTEEQEKARDGETAEEVMVPIDQTCPGDPEEPLGEAYLRVFFRRGLEGRVILVENEHDQIGVWDVAQTHAIAGWPAE